MTGSKVFTYATFGFLTVVVASVAFVVLKSQSSQAAKNLPVYSEVRPFRLLNERGTVFTHENLKGRVSIADFIFTRCGGPCPLLSGQMRALQTELSDVPNLQLVSVSVDPEYDTPTVLSKYAKTFGADPKRWTFLTGPKKDIVALSREGMKLSAGDDPSMHSTTFALIDPRGRVRGYYDSQDSVRLSRLRADARNLSLAR